MLGSIYNSTFSYGFLKVFIYPSPYLSLPHPLPTFHNYLYSNIPVPLLFYPSLESTTYPLHGSLQIFWILWALKMQISIKSKLESTHEREHGVFIFLFLGYFMMIISSFICVLENFIFLCSWIDFYSV